jgi:SpoU rRNA methylase family enzyme
MTATLPAGKKHDLIRIAWKAGKRTIVLDDIKYNLTKQVNKVVYLTGPQHAKSEKTREDVSILAKRADGLMLPVINTLYSSRELS